MSVIAEYSNPPTVLPSVTTGSYTVDGTTVTISGTLTSVGSYSIAERGICYSTSSQTPSPWSDDCSIAEGTDIGTFECVMHLQPNTQYYARAYAKTWVEPLAGYGDVVSFTTSNDGGNNLIYNGDFELGNVGFETSYVFGNTGTYNHYYVGHDIYEMWPWATPGFIVGDHTSGEGLFLMVDGALQSNSIVWSQTITVTPNTDYVLSAWFLTDNIGYVKFEINNDSGPDISTPEEHWVWEQQSMVWNSGNSTEATVKIINRYAQSSGYDYCIDDIYFGAIQ